MDRVLCMLIYIIKSVSRLPVFFSRLGIGSYEEWKPGEKIKILLVGYNGARNTGSDVRVAAIAKQIQDLFGKDQVKITVMTMDEKSLEGYFDEDVDLLTFSSLFPRQLYRACTRHHVAVLCEGSTLKSTFANALTLFLCEAAGVMSGQRKPCIAYGSEVGKMEPFVERASKKLCRDTYFIARTQDSLQMLKKLRLKGHAGTDAAWSYDTGIKAEGAAKMLCDQGWDGKTPLLGIAVINPFCWPVRSSLLKWIKSLLSGDRSGQYDKWYFFSDSHERRADYDLYIGRIAEGINLFLQKHNYFPVLIGMERLDENACNSLRLKLPYQSAVFLSGDCSAEIMTGILRSLSMLVTSRYHAAVLSMEAGCPIIAISMDERLNSIMKELSFEERYLLSVTEQDLGSRLFNALTCALDEGSAIREHIQTQLTVYKKKLEDMGTFMKQYIEDSLNRRFAGKK